MPSLTIRNIPLNVLNRLKALAEIKKRSMNSEILFIIEKGLDRESNNKEKRYVSPETRRKIWNSLSGKWKDDRQTEDIIEDIISSRSRGREFEL